METIGDRIRRERLNAGMTQPELAKSCGVTKQAVSSWESGNTGNIRLANLLALSVVFNVHVQWLIDGKPPKNKQFAPKDRIWLDITDLPESSRSHIKNLVESLAER